MTILKNNVMNAKLKFPILGCLEIRLVEKREFKWLAELIGVGMHIEVYEDEFVLEKQSHDGLALSFSDSIQANNQHTNYKAFK